MTHINQRRDTAANWIVVDPILQEGEVGWETDTVRSKLGNGVDVWTDLPYTLDTTGLAPLDSPAFTGSPTVPTVSSTDNDTTAASTAFVHSITDPLGEVVDLKAPIESPALTGNPTAPTPTALDSDQSIATTEFVTLAIADGLVGATTTPPGIVSPFAGAAAPSGYLLCDGSAVSRAIYDDLFAVIGTTFGAGDGSTTFNVPNLEGRTVFGIDDANLSFDTRGELGGNTSHSHTLSDDGWARIYVNGTTGDVEMDFVGTAGWTSTRAAATTLAGSGGNSNPGGAELDGATDVASHLPPYMALHYVIKT